jgi:hypothetical protein
MAITHQADSRSIVIRPQPAVVTVHGGVPRVVVEMSEEGLREVVKKLRAVYLEATEAETVAELIEPNSPELARHARAMTPEQLQGWIGLLLALITTVLGYLEWADDDPAIQINQPTINIEQNQTTISFVVPQPPTSSETEPPTDAQ